MNIPQKDLSPTPAVRRGQVYLVDDNADVCQHTGALLRCLGYDVETYTDGQAFLSMIPRLAWPAAILLDMRMPKITGLGLQSALQQFNLPFAIVFMSGESEPPEVVKAMKEGAIDFIFKPVAMSEIEQALDAALERARQTSQLQTLKNRIRESMAQLTPREISVLPLMLDGNPNREIAQLLDIQAGTVKKHRSAICEKFGIESTSGIIALFRQAGEMPAHPVL